MPFNKFRSLSGILLWGSVVLPSTLPAIIVDFNSTSDLNTLFNPSSPSVMFNSATGGLGNTGSVTIPASASEVHTLISSFGNGASSYVASAYMYNATNSGTGGLIFATQSTNQLGATTYQSPANSIGVIFHGGQGSFTNNNGTSDVTWGGGDLALNQWFKFTLTVTPQGSNVYDLGILIENSDANGLILGTRASQSVTGLVNTSVGGASQLYAAFMHTGSRFTALDNFAASATAIPEPSTYAIWAGLAMGAAALIRRRRRQG